MIREPAAEDLSPLHCAFAYASPTVQLVLPLELRAGATAGDAREAAHALLAAGDAAANALEAAGGVLSVRPDVLHGLGSAVVAALAEIPWVGGECAIFGEATGWDRTLRAGDRVEVLRPLRADPRASRRHRVAEARKRAVEPAASGPGSGGG